MSAADAPSSAPPLPGPDAVLLLIDLQRGFDEPGWGERNNPDAEARVAELLRRWRSRQAPVVHVHHASTEPDSPLRPERPGHRPKPGLEPVEGETRMVKAVNSCFVGTELEQWLADAALREVVCVGLTTDHCVSTTVRMGANLGHRMWVVSDATATHDRVGPDGAAWSAEQMHSTALASLSGEFATIVRTSDLLG